MQSPFQFGTLVSGNSFYDRTESFRELKGYVESGVNVVFHGPRRYGKSSLVAKVVASLNDKEFICITMDLMQVDGLGDFFKIFAQKVVDSRSSTMSFLQKLLQLIPRLRPTLSFGDDGKPVVSLDIAPEKITAESVEDLLGMTEKLAESAGRRVLVVFDEFQEIARFKTRMPFEGVLRSIIQRQKNTRYVFLGSQSHLLQRMFSDATRPFYRAAVPMTIGKPPRVESIQYVQSRMKDVGVRMDSDCASALVDTADNIPYYIQALALEVHVLKSGTQSPCTLDEVAACWRRIVEQNRVIVEHSLSTLAEGQRLLLRALAQEPVATFRTAYRKQYGLSSPSSINSAAKKLKEQGHVAQEDGLWRIADPVFSAYLRGICER